MSSGKLRESIAITILAILTAVSFMFPTALCNYSLTYELSNSSDPSANYRLNVAVSQSLYDYYVSESHTLANAYGFAKFVTPNALQPIADSLSQIYVGDEDFVNGALVIVHQIPYEATAPSKYPVETIVDNKGDCDLFSFIAASILKAHGLSVVLLYYEKQAHMNLGVNLAQEPHEARGEISFVTNGNTRYYVAECTGGNWRDGWRVGECPDELKNTNPQVITLENSESSSPEQVTTSYRTLSSSAITLSASTTFAIQGSTVILSGLLSPHLQNETVTIYIRTNGMSWNVSGKAATDSNGAFSFAWIADASAVCYVRASWSGDENYSAADSQTLTITTLSMFFVLMIGATLALLIIGAAVYVVSRPHKQEIFEPQPPEIPP
jgi:hypothetical protein